MCKKKIILINRIRKDLYDILGGSIGICSYVTVLRLKRIPGENCVVFK